jgi:hypothetical protein
MNFARINREKKPFSSERTLPALFIAFIYPEIGKKRKNLRKIFPNSTFFESVADGKLCTSAETKR